MPHRRLCFGKRALVALWAGAELPPFGAWGRSKAQLIRRPKPKPTRGNSKCLEKMRSSLTFAPCSIYYFPESNGPCWAVDIDSAWGQQGPDHPPAAGSLGANGPQTPGISLIGQQTTKITIMSSAVWGLALRLRLHLPPPLRPQPAGRRSQPPFQLHHSPNPPQQCPHR